MVAPFYRGPLPERALSPQVYESKSDPDFTGTKIGLRERRIPESRETSNSFIGVDLGSFLGGSNTFVKPVEYFEPNLEDQYDLSPAAQKTKDFLNQKIGKEIVLQKVEPISPEGAHAYYKSEGPGGSLDPRKRALYVRPDVTYPVLFHEVGHAADPMLATRADTFNPNVINNLKDPGARLEYVFEHVGKPSVKSETEAQSFVGRNLPAYEKQNPNLNIGSDRFINQPYFKEYPADFATKAVDNFYRAELSGRGQDVIEEDADRGVARRIFQPSSEKALDFALNPELKKKEDEVLDFTRQYIDARLNQFQDKPTPPATNYFSPVN